MNRKRFLVYYGKYFIYESEEFGDRRYVLEGESAHSIEEAILNFFSNRTDTGCAYDADWKFYNITNLSSLQDIKKLVLVDKLTK